MRKTKKCIFGRDPKASYFMRETLIVQKVAYILASLFEGKWFSYLFSVLRKISYKLEKMEKIRVFSSSFYSLKNSERKKFDVVFGLKRSLRKLRKITETMNAIFGLGHEIYELEWKRKRNFWKKKLKFFWQKNESVVLDDGNFVGPKSSLYQCCSSRKRTVSVSVLRNMNYEREKVFRKNFCPFFPKNTKYEKKLTSFFG